MSEATSEATTTEIPVLAYDNRICAFNVRISGPWLVSVASMVFNDRILLSNLSEYPRTWTAGWCYDKGGSALHAAMLWDPDVEREPAGFKKVAADSRPPQP
jgi:hypothetical protein